MSPQFCFSDLSVDVFISLKQPLGDHVSADRAEVIVKVGDDQVDFALGVVAPVFECFRNLLKDDELLLPLRGY